MGRVSRNQSVTWVALVATFNTSDPLGDEKLLAGLLAFETNEEWRPKVERELYDPGKKSKRSTRRQFNRLK